VDQNRLALSDGNYGPSHLVGLDERAAHFDDGERVVVDGETDDDVRARVDEPDAVRLVRLQSKMIYRCVSEREYEKKQDGTHVEEVAFAVPLSEAVESL
jgi:hypothetical protein